MIDFTNIKKISPPALYGTGLQYAQGKKDYSLPEASQAGAADVIQISADAAFKGRISAFSAALVKELNAAGTERIALLKEQYAGDRCPITGADIAGAILARIRVEGLGLAEGSIDE